MATHDYVIDNSTGANVRADINNVLQAILTNNSSSSAPSTTAAYMWWADTTSGILKIRNSANNAWVELLQLDGTLTLEDGSVSAPALAFRDDLNTGIFSSAADTFNVATAGVERMELGATTIFNEDGADVDFRIEGDTDANLFYVDAGNDRVGISTAIPTGTLSIESGLYQSTAPDTTGDDLVISGNQSLGMSFITAASGSSNNNIYFGDTDDTNIGMIRYAHANNSLQFQTNTSERMRIQSTGAVHIGTSTDRLGEKLHVLGDGIVSSSAENTNLMLFGTFGTSTALIGAFSNIPVIFRVNNTERMRIDSSGNVGIGDTDPDQKLVVGGSGTTILKVQNTDDGTAQLTLGNVGSSNLNLKQNNGQTAFDIGGVEKMRLVGNGLAIGRTTMSSEGNRLVVEAPNNEDCVKFKKLGSNNKRVLTLMSGRATGSTTANMIVFDNASNNSVGTIQSTNSSTLYNTSSDYRLKENAVAISDGIKRLKTLKPYRFNWKVDPTTTVDGFFAHEVTAVPEAVSGTKDEVITQEMIDNDNAPKGSVGDPIYQGIDQSKLVPLLVAAVQELITKVETLEAA